MPADSNEQRIGVMGIFFSVILSEAKDLMPVASGDEILRFAQDDNGKHPRPATRVSATKVSLWLPVTPVGVMECTPWVRQQNSGQWVDHWSRLLS
jgi:hypothetical protein